MGGTPWKSKGCNTCKRRKVKCDFQRPHCARCLRGGFRCEGYNRTRRFIHTFSQADDPKEQIVQRKAAESSAPLTVINVNSQIRSQLFSLFIDSYMPSCPSGQIAYRCQPAPNLVPLLPALMNGSNHQLLDRATSALASVFVGKKFGNAQLTTHGMQLYNHAIHMFLRILPQDGLPIQEVLCANMIFQLYEVINCSSGFTAWTAHMQGANAVLARHHNALPRDHLSTMLIRHLKLSNIFHAIGKQKRALFFCPTVLDLSDSLPKNDFIDDIIDILLTCTELIEHMAQVQSVNYAARLIECCLNVKQQADSWEERLQAQHENALFTTTTAKTNTSPSISSTALFSESYQFAAPEIAEAYMLYWSALLVIFSVLHGAELWRLSDANGSAEQKMAYQQRAALFSRNAEFHANQICRGVGYFIQPDMHILGGHSVLFPMAMTSQFFHRNGLKSRFEWCQEVFASLEKIGLGLAHIIQGTPWDRYQVGEAEIATDNSRN